MQVYLGKIRDGKVPEPSKNEPNMDYGVKT